MNKYSRCGLTIDLYNGNIKFFSLYVIFLLIIPSSIEPLSAATSTLFRHFRTKHLSSTRDPFPLKFLVKPYYAFHKVPFHSLFRCEDI